MIYDRFDQSHRLLPRYRNDHHAPAIDWMYAMQTDDSSALDGNKSTCYDSYLIRYVVKWPWIELEGNKLICVVPNIWHYHYDPAIDWMDAMQCKPMIRALSMETNRYVIIHTAKKGWLTTLQIALKQGPETCRTSANTKPARSKLTEEVPSQKCAITKLSFLLICTLVKTPVIPCRSCQWIDTTFYIEGQRWGGQCHRPLNQGWRQTPYSLLPAKMDQNWLRERAHQLSRKGTSGGDVYLT